MAATIPTLLAQLRAADPAARWAAAEALMALGPEARPAAAALAQATGDAEEGVREAAVGALEELGPPLPAAVAELVTLLAAGDDRAYWAATLLGRLGPAAAPAVPALSETLTGEGELAARERAAWALGQIGPPARSAAEQLRAAAQGAEKRLARLAEEALAAIGS